MSEYRWPFFVGLGVGTTMMAIAIVGAFSDFGAGGLVTWGVWIVGVDIGHDFVLAPLVVLVGVVVALVAPRAIRPPVQVGLVASGVVVLIGWLPLQSTAAATGNATIQPLDYTTAILWVLGGVWLVCGVWAAVRVSGRRSARRRSTREVVGAVGTAPGGDR